MALKVADRVKQLTTSTGTGDISFSATPTGFISFSSVLTNGDTTYYCIEENDKWEVGVGIYGSDNMVRSYILASSNGGNAINLGGSGTVFITYPAGRSVYQDEESQTVIGSSGIVFSNGTVVKEAKITELTDVDSSGTILSGNLLSFDSTHQGLLIGDRTGPSNDNNTLIGYGAASGTTGTDNTVLGTNAFTAGNGGIQSVSIGSFAGPSEPSFSSSSSYSVSIGYKAGSRMRSNSTAIGYQAGIAAYEEGFVAIGASAGSGIGSFSVAVGKDAANGSTSNYIVAVGHQAGKDAGGDNSVWIGDMAGLSCSSSSKSVGIGYQAGKNSSGSNSIYIGKDAGHSSAEANYLYIGNGTPSSSRTLIKGDMQSKRLAVGAADVTLEDTLYVGIASSVDTGLVVRGAASQTANLQEWQDFAGGIQAKIASSGILGANGVHVSGQGVTIDSSVPTNTTNALYSIGGTLYWNLSPVGVPTGVPTEVSFYDGLGRLVSDPDFVFDSGSLVLTAGSTSIGDRVAINESSSRVRVGRYVGDDGITDSNFVSAFGYQTATNASGANNSLIAGYYTAYNSIDLSYSQVIGSFAGLFASGEKNTYVGEYAGAYSSGTYNTFIGHQAGRYCKGSQNIEILASGAVNSVIDNHSNKLHIGNTIIGDTSNKKLAIGNVDASNVAPDATLEILPKNNTDIGVIIQGATSQSANLQEWQASNAVPVVQVSAEGNISASGSISASGAFLIDPLVPSVTTNKLYNDGGTLKFNGSVVGADDDTYVSGIAVYASGQSIDNEADLVYVSGIAAYASGMDLNGLGDVSYGETNLTNTLLINNVAGSSPLHGTLTGNNENNIGIGYYALGSITDADTNVALGYFANRFLTTGYNNVSIGGSAGEQMTTGYRNIQIGQMAHQYANDGAWNIAIGQEALRGNSDGTSTTENYNNIAIGHQALNKIETGDSNTAVGDHAGEAVTTGSQNVLLGRYAGDDVTTESQMLYIGYQATSSNGTFIKGDMLNRHLAIGMADTNFVNSAGSPTLQVYPANAADEAIFAKMAASHSANLIQIQDSSGADLFVVNSAGEITTGSISDNDAYVSGVAVYASGQAIENETDISYVSGIAVYASGNSGGGGGDVTTAQLNYVSGIAVYGSGVGVYASGQAIENEAAIATNVSNISTNTSNISTNTGRVNYASGLAITNELNVAYASGQAIENETAIATNTSNISTNTSNISTNSGRITYASGQAIQNEIDIAYVSGAAVYASGSVHDHDYVSGVAAYASGNTITTQAIANYASGQAIANETDIATNTSNISTNTTNIATNTSRVAYASGQAIDNETDIAYVSGVATYASGQAIENEGLATYASGQAIENETAIATNTSNISTNTSNISTNTARVDYASGQAIQNETDIAYTSGIATYASGNTIVNDGLIAYASGNTANISFGSNAEGDLLYHDGTSFVRLAKGTDNYILKMNGNVPNWEAESSGGDVSAADFNYVSGVANYASGNTIATQDIAVYASGSAAYASGQLISTQSVDFTAGDGLTGGGTLASDRTFAVGAGNLIDVQADQVDVDLTEAAAATIAHGDNLIFLDGGAAGAASKGSTDDLAALLAGDGLTKSNSVMAVNVDDSTIETNSDAIRVKDNGITLAKMAGLARGKIIYGDSNGDPAALALGGANQVLTSDGTDVTWADNVNTYLSGVAAYSSGNTIVNDGLVAYASGNTANIAFGSNAEGDLLYHNGTSFVRLARGADDTVLKMNGNVPNWEEDTGGGGGDVTTAQLNYVSGIAVYSSGIVSDADVIIGQQSTTAGTGIAIGYGAGLDSSLDNSSVANGYQASDVLIGHFAGSGYIHKTPGIAFSSAQLNTMVGYKAGANSIDYLSGTTSLGYNVFVGHQAGHSASGYQNTFIGESAGYQGSGIRNIGLGHDARRRSSGEDNIAIGSNAGYDHYGNHCVYIGYLAGDESVGNNNIEIVTDGSSPSSIGSNSNKLNIEHTIIGDTSAKKLAIGNVTSSDLTPDATLEIKPKAATDTGLIVQAATSQSATLQEWQNSSETKLLAVGPDGGLEIPSNTPSTTTNKLYNVGGTLTFNGSAVGGGGMTNFTLAGDGGSNQTIADGNTLTVAGGNGITTTGAATDTVSIAVDAAQTTITSLLATDIKIGEDDETKIDFETANEIHFYANNVEQVYLADNIFGPQSDSDVDLGSTSVRWKDAYVDSITVTGEIDGDSLDIEGDADINGTTNLDAVDIDGNVQIDGTVTVGVDDTGKDVKFYGATSGSYLEWDESVDTLNLVGAAYVQEAVPANDTPTAEDATVTLDLRKGNFHNISLGQNVTKFEFTNAKRGQRFILRITQNASSAKSVSWSNVDSDSSNTSATIRWASNRVPTMSTSTSHTDVYGFLCTNNAGTAFDGFIIGQDLPD